MTFNVDMLQIVQLTQQKN